MRGSPYIRGYHSLLSSFGKVFHVEKRWKLIREMGSGAYGVVMSVQYFLVSGFASYFDRHRSAADEISGETVAIKLVTRVFDKIQLAKRALREITLLRHFANHENITGLIDVDAISPDFNEMFVHIPVSIVHLHSFEAHRYIFMEVSRVSRRQQAFHAVELPVTAYGR